MKRMKGLYKKTLLLSLCAVVAAFAHSQDRDSAIKASIEAKQFVFHAQTALPQSGTSRHLTSDYDLKVSENTVVSYLPFFGRAYSLPYNPTDGGFNFTSTKFDYTAIPGKKGGWEIRIRPRDVQDFREFALSVSKSGYGTLHVLSNNRQAISFTGYVSAK